MEPLAVTRNLYAARTARQRASIFEGSGGILRVGGFVCASGAASTIGVHTPLGVLPNCTSDTPGPLNKTFVTIVSIQIAS